MCACLREYGCGNGLCVCQAVRSLRPASSRLGCVFFWGGVVVVVGVCRRRKRGGWLFSHHCADNTKEGFSPGPQCHYIISSLLVFMLKCLLGCGERKATKRMLIRTVLYKTPGMACVMESWPDVRLKTLPWTDLRASSFAVLCFSRTLTAMPVLSSVGKKKNKKTTAV